MQRRKQSAFRLAVVHQLDFYNDELKKYVEIDGEQHYLSDEAVKRDKVRTEFLENKGWVGMRVRWSTWQALSDENKKDTIQAIKSFLCKTF